jgi:hypothetical protein
MVMSDYFAKGDLKKKTKTNWVVYKWGEKYRICVDVSEQWTIVIILDIAGANMGKWDVFGNETDCDVTFL